MGTQPPNLIPTNISGYTVLQMNKKKIVQGTRDVSAKKKGIKCRLVGYIIMEHANILDNLCPGSLK